jgi:hypothetical protein
MAFLLIGNVFQLSVSRFYNVYLGAICEGILKTWLEMSKINSQMGVNKPDLALLKFSWKNCVTFGILRDLTYRAAFINLLQFFTRGPSYDKSVYLNSILTATSIATVLSHPFDVMFTKFASQQEPKYAKAIQSVQTVIKE